MPGKNLLTISNLKIAYNSNGSLTEVLHEISLQVKQGEAVGIVGESGSGKSQTALTVMQLIEGRPGITGGSIQFNGKTLTGLSESEMSKIRGHEIGIIFQDAKASLIPYHTIKEQVLDTYKSLAKGRSKQQMLDEAVRLLKRMNFRNPQRILDSYPNQLSGGECQRAYIMLALLGEPKLMIADEPTSSLDPVTSLKLIDLLTEICQEKEIALILISHDLAEIVRATDYVYVFFNGYIVEEFPSEWIRDELREPLHPYSRFLFSMFKGEAFASLKQNKEESMPTALPREAKNGTIASGCIYKERCSLKKDLRKELRDKCEDKNPCLQHCGEQGKVACWAAIKTEKERYED